MRSATYYRVRTSVRFLFWTVVGALALTALYLLATHVNWTDSGWCFKDMSQCYKEGL